MAQPSSFCPPSFLDLDPGHQQVHAHHVGHHPHRGGIHHHADMGRRHLLLRQDLLLRRYGLQPAAGRRGRPRLGCGARLAAVRRAARFWGSALAACAATSRQRARSRRLALPLQANRFGYVATGVPVAGAVPMQAYPPPHPVSPRARHIICLPEMAPPDVKLNTHPRRRPPPALTCCSSAARCLPPGRPLDVPSGAVCCLTPPSPLCHPPALCPAAQMPLVHTVLLAVPAELRVPAATGLPGAAATRCTLRLPPSGRVLPATSASGRRAQPLLPTAAASGRRLPARAGQLAAASPSATPAVGGVAVSPCGQGMSDPRSGLGLDLPLFCAFKLETLDLSTPRLGAPEVPATALS